MGALTVISVGLLYATAFVDPGFVPRDLEEEAAEEGQATFIEAPSRCTVALDRHPELAFSEIGPVSCSKMANSLQADKFHLLYSRFKYYSMRLIS